MFIEQLLCTRPVPGSEDTIVNKTDKAPAPMELTVPWREAVWTSKPAKQLQGVVQTIIFAAPNWPSRWQRTKWISYGLIAVFIGHKDLEAMDTGDSISPYNIPGKQGTTEDHQPTSEFSLSTILLPFCPVNSAAFKFCKVLHFNFSRNP